MRDLWLVVNFAFYRYNNYLARGDYSKGARFQNGCFVRVFNVTQRVINAIEENITLKSTKDDNMFRVTLFERKVCSFCWLNWINPSNSNGKWLLISIRVLETILTEWFQKLKEFKSEIGSTWAILLKQYFAIILKQLFASYSTSSRGLFNNIHWGWGE